MTYENHRTAMILEVSQYVGANPEQWEDMPISRRQLYLLIFLMGAEARLRIHQEALREAQVLRDIDIQTQPLKG